MKIGILLYDKVEELDFVGPLEVFNVANEALGHAAFAVFTVSAADRSIKAVNGLRVFADYDLTDCPAVDILLVPGGNGRKQTMNDETVLQWVQERYGQVRLLLSVCTGAFILGNAGLLQKKRATTNRQCYREFAAKFKDTVLEENVTFVKDENIVTSGGISAGITMSLFVVGDLLGKDVARKTAALMEYDYHP